MNFDPSKSPAKSAVSRYKRAFLDSINLMGMAGFVGVSLAMLSPGPLLVGLVLEAAYLMFVPDTKWFTKRLGKQFDAEVIQHRQELKDKVYPKVPAEVVAKFNWLEQARAQIESTSVTEDPWFREAMRKLDFLLEKYLQFADREAEFLKYLRTLVEENYGNFSPAFARRVPGVFIPARGNKNNLGGRPLDLTEGDIATLISVIADFYESEVSKLVDQCEKETIVATKDILTKRQDVIKRRREFVVRLGDMLVNIHQQMVLISETFGLINDEIRARSPEQVIADIDEVVIQATSLTDALDLITPSDQLVSKVS